MFDELRSFDIVRFSKTIALLWLGGWVLEQRGTYILFVVAYLIGQGSDEAVVFLRHLFNFGSYLFVVGLASYYYFRNAKRGFCQGVLLGLAGGIAWRIFHIMENLVRDFLDLPTIVRHFDPIGWLLFVVCCTAIAILMNTGNNPRLTRLARP